MNLVVLTFVFAFGWAAVTGSFSLLNMILGAVVGGAGLWVVRAHVAPPTVLPRLRRIVVLAALFVYELVLSAVRVAALVVRPDLDRHLRPTFIAFPLTATGDAEITLLANLITLTPGTLSVDVSEDRRFLYIHAIDAVDREAFIREIAEGFERHVIGACR